MVYVPQKGELVCRSWKLFFGAVFTLFLLSIAPSLVHASTAYDTAHQASIAAAAAATAADTKFNNDGLLTSAATTDQDAVSASRAQAQYAAALSREASAAAADAQAANGTPAATTAYNNANAATQAISPIVNTVNGYLTGNKLVGSPAQVAPIAASIQADKASIQSSLASANTYLASAATSANNSAAAATATATAASATTAATQTNTAAAQTAANPEPNACNIGILGGGNLWACIQGVIYGFIKLIALFFLSLSTFFLGIVGLLFNWTIYITVFQFGNLIGNNPGMLAAWGVLRDVGNILLLFGFIFMGVSTILNLPGSEFTARRALPTLIIFAILMNFSLFAAEVIIDTSNALGSTFYRQAGTGLCTSDAVTDLLRCATEYGVAGAVMQLSGITSIFSFDGGAHFLAANDMGYAIALIGLTIFAFTLAFVLLAAVFMLATRAVTLAFLMAVSPIGFAGMAVPFLHKFAKMWWEQLLKQAFFAPIYLLLVLVSVKFMDGVRTALGDSNQTLLAAFSGGGVSNLSMVVLFVLLVGFLLAATQSAKDMSAIGSSTATKFAGAATFGTIGFVSRRTVGAAASHASRAIRSSPIGTTEFGRSLAGVADKGARASFDFRTTAGGKALAGRTGDLGKPSKAASHGMHGIEEKAEKERVDYAKSLKDVKAKKDGERTESDQEFDTRRQKEAENSEKTIEEATAASELVDKATEGLNTAKDELNGTEERVAVLRAQAADKPGDASIQRQLLEEERILKSREALAGNAELKHKEALEKLTAAEKARAEAEKVKTEGAEKKVLTFKKGDVLDSKKQRQEKYGHNLERETFLNAPIIKNFTATGIANADAAHHIIHNAGRTKLEESLDNLKKSVEEGTEKVTEEVHANDQKPAGNKAPADAHH